MTKLIGICGLAGAGKDTIGNILINKFGFVKTSFAAKLKDITADLFDWDRDLVEGSTPESRQWREMKDEWWTDRLGTPITARNMLQKMGTDAVRNNIHNDIWLAATEKFILKEMEKGNSVVVTDVRFPNEIESIVNLGGMVIQVMRGGLPGWYEAALIHNTQNPPGVPQTETAGFNKVHPSEWKWIGNPYISYGLNNHGTIEDLEAGVDYIIYSEYDRRITKDEIEHKHLIDVLDKLIGPDHNRHFINGKLAGVLINPIINNVLSLSSNNESILDDNEFEILRKSYPQLVSLILIYDKSRVRNVHIDVTDTCDIEEVSTELMKIELQKI